MKIINIRKTQIVETVHKPDVRKLYKKNFPQLKATTLTLQTKLL